VATCLIERLSGAEGLITVGLTGYGRKNEIELSILLAYTGCTEGITMGRTDNKVCYQSVPLSAQDLAAFKWRYTHVYGHHAIARDTTWVN
jgi:hypothetical protein